MARRFTDSFTQQEALTEHRIAPAVADLQSGSLHRYDLLPDEAGEMAQLEARVALDAAAAREVELKWFSAKEPAGFNSAHQSLRYGPAQRLPAADRIMATLFEMRLPLIFSYDNCPLVAELICDAVAEAAS